MTSPESKRIIDITRPLRGGMPVWPGDPPCRVAWAARIDRGDPANVAELQLGAHTGTHADGPFHVDSTGPTIGSMELDAFVGPAFLVDAPAGGVLDEHWAAEVLQRIRPVRLLVRTGCWRDAAAFPTAFPAPAPGAVERLCRAGLRLYGTDAPSVDPFISSDLPSHRVLASARAAILENLLLDDVIPGEYELVALPLRLNEADASPIRAVLRPA